MYTKIKSAGVRRICMASPNLLDGQTDVLRRYVILLLYEKRVKIF